MSDYSNPSRNKYLGPLNKDTDSLAELAGPAQFSRENMVAYCSSKECLGPKHSSKGAPIYEAEYPRDHCPRCGGILYWKMSKGSSKAVIK